MRILGIDTGINGGLAVFEVADGDILGPKRGAERVVDMADIPTIDDVEAYRYVDAVALKTYLRAHSPDVVYMEKVRAMPSIPGKGGFRRSMGASSAMNFGDARGSIRSVVLCHGVKLVMIEPQAWKRAFGLKGSDKEMSRQCALGRCPKAAKFLKRKKDHGRAEALLIAIYGASKVADALRVKVWEGNQNRLSGSTAL